jgi:threonine/homoserine/homoserine lactone efflux protein
METFVALCGILAVLLVGIVSPGPSFVLVARTAIASSRRAGIASALGMAFGAMVLALLALAGLHALLQKMPAAYLALKVGGGLYLLYLALRIWQGAALPLRIADAPQPADARLRRHFWIAALTMLGNPKAAVQYGVIFAALLPAAPSAGLLIALPPSVFALELGWYLVVALALSSSQPRQRYLRAKAVIDRTTAIVLALLGIKLMLAPEWSAVLPDAS